MKMILTVLKLKSDHDFRRKNSKGAYVRKNVGAVMFFFFLCISSDGGLYLYKIS